MKYLFAFALLVVAVAVIEAGKGKGKPKPKYVPDPGKGGSKSLVHPGNRDHISGTINDAENIVGLGDQSTSGSQAIQKTIKSALKIVNLGSNPKFPPKKGGKGGKKG